MTYHQYTITTDPEHAEALLGLLSALPFDSFAETETGWQAYLPPAEETTVVDRTLEAYKAILPFSYTKAPMPQQNWNAVWESNFEPIRVGDFCGIRAEFHPPFEGVKHDLVIQPKMAFGTGHHETTYMMIEQMEELEWEGKRVLDYGAGTGILAILAIQLGAEVADAVEIDPQACENAEENVRRNQTPAVHVIAGTLEKVGSQAYDIILANINRNVILDSLAALFDRTLSSGTILFSGILQTDGEKVLQAATTVGFVHQLTQQRGEWLCMVFSKRNQ